MKRNSDQIKNLFTYHSPSQSQIDRMVEIRNKAREFAILVNDLTPISSEAETSLVKLQEAVFWANASMVRNEPKVKTQTGKTQTPGEKIDVHEDERCTFTFCPNAHLCKIECQTPMPGK